MARPKLISVKLLANKGARIKYRSSRGQRERFERPNGFLTVLEASRLLETYPNMVYRMGAAGRLALRPGTRFAVSLAECRAILALPRHHRATAGPAPAHKGARS